jgi:predicted ATPase/class 3 adenylate cyclase
VSAPTGTVAFLFTDIEGSTRLWQVDSAAMQVALSRHEELLRAAVVAHDGVVFATMGDGIAVAFASASRALDAAVAAQTALASEPWPTASPLRVRMGIHTGEAELRGGDYFGTAVNRAARLMAIGHGGQILVSSTTAELLEDDSVVLVNLGDHRLRDFDTPMRVFQVGVEGFPALRSLNASPGNLPLQVNSFVGRERDLERGAQALRSARVVTLTGVGGVGKTRLALQLAAQVASEFRDGVWLVELAATRDPDRLADAFTAAFGVIARFGQSAEVALLEFLAAKQLLLVVDNCEHLLDPLAALLERVQRSCPEVRVLATSREGLTLDGERLLAVPSLAAPSPDATEAEIATFESVSLFLERAQRLDAEFVLSAGNAGAVAEICRRLDGIPLGIELAAARVRAMSPAELASGLNHRFETLAGGRRGAVQRHQTLRAAIDWSYDLLEKPERLLLARLSVFAGGCTRDAAQSVCSGEEITGSAVFELLSGLVDRSLVVADRDGAETRYRLLETIREYAEEHLGPGEGAALQAAHGEYYAQLAEDYCVHAHGPQELEWARWVTSESENLVAAMNWANDTENADIGLRIVTNVHSMHREIGLMVPISVTPVLDLPGARDHPLYPMALAKAGYELSLGGDRFGVQELCNHAIEAERQLGNPSGGLVEMSVHAALGSVEVTHGSWTAAAEHNQRAGELALLAGDSAIAARWFANAAGARFGGEEDTAAIATAHRSVELAREAAGPLTISVTLSFLAMVLADTDPSQSQALLRDALAAEEHLGNTNCAQLLSAANLAARVEDWPLSLRLVRRAIPLAAWTSDRIMLQGAFIYSAAALADPRPRVAARLLGASRSMRPPSPTNQSETERATGPSIPVRGMVTNIHREAARRITTALTQDQVAQLRAEGEAMGLEQAVKYASIQIDDALTDPTIEWAEARTTPVAVDGRTRLPQSHS